MTICRICTVCGRVAPEAEILRSPAGKCRECGTQYEREKSRRRRASSTATRTRGTLESKQARAQARARDGGCVYRHHGGRRGEVQVHHLLPLDHGGTNRLDNLVTVCRAHHELVEPVF